jgi:PIN domain nuclease of toxin-antitoxin system
LAKLERMPITLLPITTRYIEIVETLPFIHRDPFVLLPIDAPTRNPPPIDSPSPQETHNLI